MPAASARRRAWDGTRLYAYGYGWRIADIDGAYTVSHTGTLSGMYSVMSLLPDRRSGFVVLINGEAEAARESAGGRKHRRCCRNTPSDQKLSKVCPAGLLAHRSIASC